MLTALILLSCAARVGTTDAAVEPVSATGPVLPSPVADLYATGSSSPRDTAVAAMAAGLPWDEALSGAAGALAMMPTSAAPTLAQARFAAATAGYPYEVRSLTIGKVLVNTEPAGLLEELRRQLQPGEDLGLARARLGEQERWVALFGARRGSVDPFPRTLVNGEELVLKGTGDRAYVVSPRGDIIDLAMPATVALTTDGEWWVEVWSGSSRVVGVPVMVGRAAFTAPYFDGTMAKLEGPQDAEDDALDLVDTVRQSFGLLPLQDDGTLAQLARLPVDDVAMGRFDRATAETRLQGAGFVGGSSAAVACTGDTVGACVDTLMRSGQDRAALLNPGMRLAGAAAQVSTSGVAIVMNMASE
jgi:hypothetical protein